MKNKNTMPPMFIGRHYRRGKAPALDPKTGSGFMLGFDGLNGIFSINNEGLLVGLVGIEDREWMCPESYRNCLKQMDPDVLDGYRQRDYFIE
mgnify:CR=1 FL=1